VNKINRLTKDVQSVIKSISNEFAIAGDFIGGHEIDTGHINTTYLAEYEEDGEGSRRYILQCINGSVFKDPLGVMNNVEYVTRHITWKALRGEKDFCGQTLNLYSARGGRFYVEGENGCIWRCYNFIEGCQTYDVVETTQQAYQAARAFGLFQNLVSDLNVDDIVETIPDFHDTRKRYDRLMTVVRADPFDRLESVKAEVDFVRERKNVCSRLIELKEEGVLPERITHNDTKFNNVMMDAKTDEAVCVIDLDTVMPGLSLYDFGDLVRTATSPTSEDERDLTKVQMRMPIFEALVRGYLDGCDCLCEEEVKHLVFGSKVITLETGIRFLTDYLEGDIYFKVSREGQNLDRCRTQFALLERIEEKEGVMNDIVNGVVNR